MAGRELVDRISKSDREAMRHDALRVVGADPESLDKLIEHMSSPDAVGSSGWAKSVIVERFDGDEALMEAAIRLSSWVSRLQDSASLDEDGFRDFFAELMGNRVQSSEPLVKLISSEEVKRNANREKGIQQALDAGSNRLSGISSSVDVRAVFEDDEVALKVPVVLVSLQLERPDGSHQVVSFQLSQQDVEKLGKHLAELHKKTNIFIDSFTIKDGGGEQ